MIIVTLMWYCIYLTVVCLLSEAGNFHMAKSMSYRSLHHQYLGCMSVMSRHLDVLA